ncbi:MAG: NAD(P)H-dependent oxidoreductase [Oligoflexia bacterium]|nr:NAD(P)H-dependent oxidoreductase [Oligoflexia bacterium]MBF0364533.1 NAD(P)H-dependent oxidoreductase [Oligoflexia bacterium]
MKILVVHSSANTATSTTREYTEKVVQKLKSKYQHSEVVVRDLIKNPIPHFDPLTLKAFFTKAEERSSELKEAIKFSEQVTDEFLAADVVVIGAPMYNFSIPAVFKGWIDYIVRVGRTFHYTATGPKGLVDAQKELLIVTASGSVYHNSAAKDFDHQELYLRHIFGFLGISKIDFIRVEGTAVGGDIVKKSREVAEEKLSTIIARL